jgi:hypothetical protein
MPKSRPGSMERGALAAHHGPWYMPYAAASGKVASLGNDLAVGSRCGLLGFVHHLGPDGASYRP